MRGGDLTRILSSLFWMSVGMTLVCYLNTPIVSDSSEYSTPREDIETPLQSSDQQLDECTRKMDTNWSASSADGMNLTQVIEYVEWTNSTSCRLRHSFGGSLTVQNMGIKGQKSVCMDPAVSPEADNCLVYSFGDGIHSGFEEAIATFGCQVHVFDWREMGTSASKNITFHQLRRSTISVPTIYETLKHQGRVIDYLKLNANGGEWAILTEMIQSGMMDRVKQFGLSIHLPKEDGMEEFRSRAGILLSMEKQGLVRFDSKHIPWSMDWNPFVEHEGPMVYELAYFNNNLRQTLSQSPPEFVANKVNQL